MALLEIKFHTKVKRLFEGIKGKKVLVTGASTGIGACIAELFSSYGAIVGIHYRQSEGEASAVLNSIRDSGGEAMLFKGDLLKKSIRATLINSFIDAFGGIEVLVNNAGGIYGYHYFLELDEESWNDTFALNATAPFFLAKETFSFMKDHGGGRIINISSISAKYGGSPQSLHYAASKAALDAVTVGLARAGASFNILVNSIRGGFVNTQFHKRIGRTNIEDRIKLIPLKRAGKPLDIARLALFLASETGDYITGEIFTVAGGD